MHVISCDGHQLVKFWNSVKKESLTTVIIMEYLLDDSRILTLMRDHIFTQ